MSAADYLSKRFRAWDGEGVNEPDGSHTYILLASSEGHSVYRREGIGTIEAFELLLAANEADPDAIDVIYGGGYDINMILKDLERKALEEIYFTGKVKWRGYKIEWRGGKSLSVRTMARSFLLYDVLPFFQRSFVSACDEYLGGSWDHRAEIIRDKARRGSFTAEEIEGIAEYNSYELSTLVRLVNELRSRLYKVDIRVSRWDGPGAIASSLYKKYETKSHLGTSPNEVARAARYAYAGGRFEIIRKGHSDRPIWQYDIRSAYPSAARNLPCLAHGRWEHVRNTRDIARFGIYRIEVIYPPSESMTQPQPLWMRNKDGTVFFNEYTHGWYWSPEAQMVKELPGWAQIHEGYVWRPDCDHEPFWFVEPLYNKRAALKRAGDGAHIGLKLGLNSLYGKLAQQIGWDPGPPLRLPPYHCLEWAGYITSHCRANVYRAARTARNDIVAFETDAVFSRAPLDVSVGDRLGEWEETNYSSLTYLKSGLYFGTDAAGKEVEKTRGINKGTLTREAVIESLQNGEPYDFLPAEQTRFITLGQALHQDFGKWRKWITAPREIRVALNGKRIDLLDNRDVYADRHDGWNETQEGFTDTEFSHPYPVEWVEDEYAADMGELFRQARLDAAGEVWE